MSLCIGINKQMEDGERVGVTFYSRISIDKYFDVSKTVNPIVDLILSTYEEIEDSRKDISMEMHQGTEFEDPVGGMKLIKNSCNMDAAGFHQPFVSFTTLLAEHFSLNFAEIVSVLMAYSYIPNSSYYFILASVTLLQESMEKLKEKYSIYSIGYLMVMLMERYKKEYQTVNKAWNSCGKRKRDTTNANKDNKKNVEFVSPGSRYNLCTPPGLPNKLVFERRCETSLEYAYMLGTSTQKNFRIKQKEKILTSRYKTCL